MHTRQQYLIQLGFLAVLLSPIFSRVRAADDSSSVPGAVPAIPYNSGAGSDGSGGIQPARQYTFADALNALKMSIRLIPENLDLDVTGEALNAPSDGRVTARDAQVIAGFAVRGIVQPQQPGTWSGPGESMGSEPQTASAAVPIPGVPSDEQPPFDPGFLQSFVDQLVPTDPSAPQLPEPVPGADPSVVESPVPVPGDDPSMVPFPEPVPSDDPSIVQSPVPVPGDDPSVVPFAEPVPGANPSGSQSPVPTPGAGPIDEPQGEIARMVYLLKVRRWKFVPTTGQAVAGEGNGGTDKPIRMAWEVTGPNKAQATLFIPPEVREVVKNGLGYENEIPFTARPNENDFDLDTVPFVSKINEQLKQENSGAEGPGSLLGLLFNAGGADPQSNPMQVTFEAKVVPQPSNLRVYLKATVKCGNEIIRLESELSGSPEQN